MNTILIKPCGYTKTISKLLMVAKQARFQYPSDTIILLGGILNAESAKKELHQLGISIVDIPYQGFQDYLKHLSPDTIVLTSPYGCDKSIIKLLKKRRIKYFETLSPVVEAKLNFINESKGRNNIIHVSSSNTIEVNFLQEEAKYCVIPYDVNEGTKTTETLTTLKKMNNKKTHILYQSELGSDNLSNALLKLKELLPEAVFEEEISDENYELKQNLLETYKDDDVVIFVSDTNKSDKFILDYYRLTTKKALFAKVRSVTDAMSLNVPSDKRILIVSDGSIPEYLVNDIYNYFNYRLIQGKLRDQQ